MRAVALATTIALAAGCFPNDPHASRIAKFSEGGAVLLGIGFLALAKTQADCDANSDKSMDCNSTGTTLQTAGLGLLIAGIIGFIATVSVEEDAKVTTTSAPAAPKPAPPPTKGLYDLRMR